MNCALGTVEGSGNFDQHCRLGILPSKPATQRFPRDLWPLAVAKPDHVDQRAFGRVEAEGQSVPDPDNFPAEIERAFGEDMNVRGRLQRRDTPAARNRDVNAIRDDIREAVAGEGADEAEGALGDPVGDFEKVVVGRRGIGPSIQAAAKLFQMPRITVAVKALRGEPGNDCVRVRED